MKKTLMFLLCLCLCWGLLACGAEAPAEVAVPPETTVPSATEAPTEPPETEEPTEPPETTIPAAEILPVRVMEDVTAAHRNDYNRDYTQSPLNRELTWEEYEFFTLFWELDQQSMLDYAEKHPELIEDGWDHIYVNEAGYKDKGIGVVTIFGEKVLAIDAQNQVLVVEVTGKTYRGALAIAKDPSRLHLCPAENLGKSGEKAGSIAERNGGVLAITGSGFIDENFNGNGGTLAGACMCDGVSYGTHYGANYERIELHEDNRLYLVNADSRFCDGTTDASEFTPALVRNGVNVGVEDKVFTENNPRACLGQSTTGEILMLGIEGRQSHSAGTDANGCAKIFLLHDAWTALNMDGGSSASLWFDGKYVIRCSNTRLSEGRSLPNAWVY